jgi:hypothetical protein
VVSSGVAICRGARDGGGSCRASWWEVLCVGKLWLIFGSRHLVLWLLGTYGLRLKADLFSWESLYLIGLNPNSSKVWILTSHLFTYCIFNT